MRFRYVLALLLTLILTACGGSSSSSSSSGSSGGSGSSSSSAGDATYADTAIALQGTVVDDRGIAISGATVKVLSGLAKLAGSDSVSTGTDGSFAFTLDAATPAVVRIEKAGFVPMFRAAGAARNNAQFAALVVLLPIASTQSFDPTQGAVLRVPGSSARVELAANSLARGDGQPPSGTAVASVTPIDPSRNISDMPGLMVDATSGLPIESLGALAVNFSDAAGAPLNLASGQTATIRIPATPAAGVVLPASFPLYHLNETTGVWTQEGTAALQSDAATGGQYYEGSVSHFSVWNADQVYQRATIDLAATVGGVACSVPAGLSVQAIGLDYNGISSPEATGFFGRASSQVRLRLVDARGNVADSMDIATGLAGTATRLPRCLSAPPKVNLTGRVTVSSGTLSNYLVRITGPKIQTIAVPIDSAGRYSSSVYANSGAVSASLVARENRGTPDSRVSATVAGVDVSFPDLTVQDTSFALRGCVSGWGEYRQTRVQVSLFRGNTMVGAPQTLQSNLASFAFPGVPLNSTLTVRLTPPDATLIEKSITVVVGNTPVTLDACVTLPKGPQATVQTAGSGLARSFEASSSIAGDAAITAYAWRFGDGSTGSGASVSHAYSAPGSYPVKLTVTDALGQESSTIVTVIATSGGTVVTVPAGNQIASGGAHHCFINAGGGAECFGYNGFGQLGGGTLDSSTLSVPVTGLSVGVSALALGRDHSCALTSSGGVKCWGYNGSGQLGNGSADPFMSSPTDVTGLTTGVVAIGSGTDHTCAVTGGGALKCWGSNSFGVLGNGSVISSRVPVGVSGLGSGVRAVSGGALDTCAVTAGAGVYCWGASNASSVPVLFSGPAVTVLSISLGGSHGCAVTQGGAVKCWGQNDRGQLGNGTNTASTTPVDVLGLGSGFISVSSGSSHSCALSVTGSTFCWGSDRYGQLGKSGTTNSNIPVLASEQSAPAIGLSAGAVATCVIQSNRSPQCWGWQESRPPD
jgi:alpha-tubulin suppressor-like RCC1 family protein